LPPGMRYSATARAVTTIAKSGSGDRATRSSAAVDTANATLLAARGSVHRWRGASQPYATQKAACETVPAIVPAAAVAAKAGPWLSVRKRATGAEVKGKPTSQPPTAGP